MRPNPRTWPQRWSVSPLDAWRLLTEPMSRNEATIAAEAITKALPHVHAIPADPRGNLVTVWDRRSAELIRDGLLSLRQAGTDVPDHLIANIEEWLQHANPDDDSIVAAVESLLESAAGRNPAEQSLHGERRVAVHALWLCACVSDADAPTWIIHDDAAGHGLAWSRLPRDEDVDDFVDAQYVAGAHTAPESVLGWLRGELRSHALDVDGDAVVITQLEPRLQPDSRH